MCTLTYAIHRGTMLTVSVPLQESPHETATWAETRESRGHGIWPRRPDRAILSCLTSILAPPPSFSSPQPSSAQPVPKRWDDNPLVNMPIKVLFALHQKKALSQPPGAHVSERLALTNYLGALRNPSVTTGVSVLHNFCAYALYHCSASIWMISMQENMYISI